MCYFPSIQMLNSIRPMHEFTLISRYFAPLAQGFPGADGLRDDAALLTPPMGMALVVTTDTMQEGVHFIGNEAPALLAQKLLRVNLSDLAAKGASPWCYLLNLGLPATCDEAWIADFARGLAEDQARYDILLAGGDTTNTKAVISLSLTAFGLVKAGHPLVRRGGAQAGDLLYVTGTIGDAALGLRVAQGMVQVGAEDAAYLLARYQRPQPEPRLAVALVAMAHAAMDVSDGLVQDIGQLCVASGVGAEVNADDVPLSESARRWLKLQPEKRMDLLVGGDDYELLLAIAPEQAQYAEALAASWCQPLTCIGVMMAEQKLELRDRSGALLEVIQGGWQHQFG